MYMCVRRIDFATFHDFDIWFWNWSDSVVYFELIRQCGIFWIDPTVWYILNWSDSVVYFELIRQCGIFWIDPTVWYIFGFYFHITNESEWPKLQLNKKFSFKRMFARDTEQNNITIYTQKREFKILFYCNLWEAIGQWKFASNGDKFVIIGVTRNCWYSYIIRQMYLRQKNERPTFSKEATEQSVPVVYVMVNVLLSQSWFG
jgi:hypothetical protein